VLSHPILGNFSFHQEHVFGSNNLRDGSYSGCLRSIRDNQTDIGAFPINFPVDDYEKVNPYQVYFEAPLMILSTYHVFPLNLNGIEYTDFLTNSFGSFDAFTWIVLAFSMIVFVVIIYSNDILKFRTRPRFLGRRFRRRKCNERIKPPSIQRALVDVVSSMSGRDHSNNNSKADAVTMMVSLFMAVSFFIIGNIYWNSASSDLVVIKHPEIIRTYSDIMNHEPPIYPMFDAFDGATDDLEFADPDSIQGQF